MEQEHEIATSLAARLSLARTLHRQFLQQIIAPPASQLCDHSDGHGYLYKQQTADIFIVFATGSGSPMMRL